MDEARRHRVYEVLRERLGEEVADLIMSRLPPTPWTELATKDDLDRALQAQSAELRAEIAQVRNEVAQVRDEVASLRLVVARQAWIMTLGVIAAVGTAVGVTATIT